jgi:hypothetical protein
MAVDRQANLIQPIAKGADSRLDWRTVNAVVDAINKSRLAEMPKERRQDTSLFMHPFRIYQLPSWMRSETAETDWCKFVVRGGLVNSVTVGKTDLETWPDDETYGGASLATTLTNEIAVDPGISKHSIWIKCNRALTSAEIAHADGDAPAFDTSDGYLQIPVGWVDTASEESNHVAKIRQLLRSDVFLPMAEFSVKDADCNDKLMMMLASTMYAPP